MPSVMVVLIYTFGNVNKCITFCIAEFAGEAGVIPTSVYFRLVDMLPHIMEKTVGLTTSMKRVISLQLVF
jgi:hypothetical protein